jgi:hypothetical protein
MSFLQNIARPVLYFDLEKVGLVMVSLLVRLECERQSLRRRLLNISGTPGASSSGYNIIMIFLVFLLSYPIVATDLAIPPVGLALLGAETGFFVMAICLGIFFILTTILAPLGIIIL